MASTSAASKRRVMDSDETTSFAVPGSAARETADRLEWDAYPLRSMGELVSDLVHGLGQDERVEHDLPITRVRRQQRIDAIGLEVALAERSCDVLLPPRAECMQ